MKTKTFWLIVLVVAMTYSCTVADSEHVAETNIFCAYGTVFIEFKEKNNTWGTVFLDNAGRPIRCDSNNRTDPVIENNAKEKYEYV